MNILIVENETPAADKLIGILGKIDKSVTVTGVCETVEETINRLQQKPQPDLILMDIQLDDGLCFEIFETITVDIPVIFTTAYDKYTLKAFKVNSVDYSLEQLQSMLDPRKFFRINRECIVNINAIETMYTYSSSRLRLTLKSGQTKEEFVVSRDKVPEFKKWIDG